MRGASSRRRRRHGTEATPRDVDRGRAARDVLPVGRGLLAGWFGGTTQTGQCVTPERATGVAAVHACVQFMAETISTLPLRPYRRLPDGDRMVHTEHPLYRVLHDQANRVQTAQELREMLVAAVALYGDADDYAIKVIDSSGAVREDAIPMHPAGGSRPSGAVDRTAALRVDARRTAADVSLKTRSCMSATAPATGSSGSRRSRSPGRRSGSRSRSKSTRGRFIRTGSRPARF